MKMLCKLVIMSALAMTAAFPAMAQQDQQQAPMMGQGQGGMMGQGQGGMMGRGQGGMMGQDGMKGQGGMMGRGGMMGQDMGGQDMSGCPMMGDMMGFGRRGMKQGMGHGAMMHSIPMMEGRLAYFKADLEIADAQMAAWDAYANAVRARHATMEGMRAEMMKAKESSSALQRLDARIKAMESKLDSLKALKPVTEGLYAVLSDEQKKKADQLLGGGCGMM
jgi:LTXXQ motif family protein